MLLAIIFACDLNDEFRTGAFSAPIERVRINNKKGADVRFISAALIGLPHQFVKDRSINGSQGNSGMTVGKCFSKLSVEQSQSTAARTSR